MAESPDDKKDPASTSKRLIKDIIADIPFATAIWNFLIREGKAVKSGWLAFIFLALLFAYFGYLVTSSIYSTKIQSLNTELSDAKHDRDRFQDTAKAAENALAPWKSLANSKFPNEPLNKRMELLFSQINEMNENFKKLNTHVDEKMKELIPSKWGMSSSQLDALSKRMEFYAPAKELPSFIVSVMGDSESVKFAASFVAAFRKAGWKLPGSGFGQAIFDGPMSGIILKIHSKNDQPAAFQELILILREYGIEPTGIIDGDIPEGEFQIIVGSKP